MRLVIFATTDTGAMAGTAEIQAYKRIRGNAKFYNFICIEFANSGWNACWSTTRLPREIKEKVQHALS